MFPKPQKAKRDNAYMRIVRTLPCLGATIDPHHVCSSRVDAAHVGKHHSNRKADDNTTVPLDHKLHLQMHSLSGPFKAWTKAELRAWREWAIMHTQEQIKSMGVKF